MLNPGFLQNYASTTIWFIFAVKIPYSWKFSRDLYFKDFVVQTKYKTLKFFKSITQKLSIAKICENYFLEIVNESKFVKYRAVENNQLYGIFVCPNNMKIFLHQNFCTIYFNINMKIYT